MAAEVRLVVDGEAFIRCGHGMKHIRYDGADLCAELLPARGDIFAQNLVGLGQGIPQGTLRARVAEDGVALADDLLEALHEDEIGAVQQADDAIHPLPTENGAILHERHVTVADEDGGASAPEFIHGHIFHGIDCEGALAGFPLEDEFVERFVREFTGDAKAVGFALGELAQLRGAEGAAAREEVDGFKDGAFARAVWADEEVAGFQWIELQACVAAELSEAQSCEHGLKIKAAAKVRVPLLPFGPGGVRQPLLRQSNNAG